MNALQLPLIHELFRAAERQNLPLWLESGWAIDARLQRITREHADINLAFPHDQQAAFERLLGAFGAATPAMTDYGFLTRIRGILIDCEPCFRSGAAYELAGVPNGSCPWEKQGMLAGVAVRCTSWEAILWEYFYYLEEIPHTLWSRKDRESFAFLQATLGMEYVNALRIAFETQRYAQE